MKTFAAILFFCMGSVALAQFADNPALNKNPGEADAIKPGENAPGLPPNADDPAAMRKPAPGAPAAPPAGATAGGGTNSIFAALDIDGDGTISKTELRKAVVSLRKLDSDNDGTLSQAECGGGAPLAGNEGNQWMDQIMAKDRNGDGRLTADELNVGEIQMLQGADQNGDKAIDRQELAQFGRGQAAGGWQQGNFAGGAAGAGVDRRAGNEAMGRFLQYDRNRDGRLTADEVPPQARGALQGADRDNDGAIDAKEMQAMIRQLGDRARALGAGGDPNTPDQDGNPRNRRRLPRNQKDGDNN